MYHTFKNDPANAYLLHCLNYLSIIKFESNFYFFWSHPWCFRLTPNVLPIVLLIQRKWSCRLCTSQPCRWFWNTWEVFFLFWGNLGGRSLDTFELKSRKKLLLRKYSKLRSLHRLKFKNFKVLCLSQVACLFFHIYDS